MHRSTSSIALACLASVAWGTCLAACGAEPPVPVVVTPAPVSTAPPATDTSEIDARDAALREAGINPAWLDRSRDPCKDFYELACGGLLKTVEIPDDETRWGPAQELQQTTDELLHKMLVEAPTQPPGESKLGVWWSACMDEPAIEAAGIRPIQPLLAIVDKVKDRRSLYAAIIELHRVSIFAAFSIGSQQDFKDATRVIAGLDQDGLGLPDRDYYIDTDQKTRDTREFYRGHVARMFELAGDKPEAAARATDEVLAIETALAVLSQDKIARRDPYKIYHRVDRRGLAQAARSFPWAAYFKGLGFPEMRDISINSVPYFQGLDALLTKESPSAWRSYLRMRVLSSQAGRLHRAFVAERFKLRQKLGGQKEIEPRWKRCVQSTDGALGELLAQEYVKARFDPASKEAAEDLVRRVRGAMKEELGKLPWMDAATREAAQEKLAKMNDKVGYPSRWKAYDFAIRPAAYAENALASDMYELARSLRKVGRPLDRGEWQMTPPTVNAYYDSSLNEMVFPAGILQPPFFKKTFSAAVNYGATGAVMGHELTHGFDDEGSQFDGSGNLRNWWSPATQKQFKEQTRCVADQYATYEALPGMKLNGDLTLGENIADIGGLKLAWTAFHEARRSEATRGAASSASTSSAASDGYTDDQLFFLAYGQSWCEKDRPEVLELMVKTNPHAPTRFRVNGAVSDVAGFAEAFACTETAPMRPATVCAVW